MIKCKFKFQLPGFAEFTIPNDNEESAEDLLFSLVKGRAPSWLETLVLESIDIEDIEVDEVRFITEPEAEEELDFGE